MKYVIGLIIVVGFSLGAWQLHQYWESVKERNPSTAAATAAPAQPEISGDQLPGLPRELEMSLQTAEQHGAPALKAFLAAHGNAIKDPRRAWIELDYVILAGATDPGEARLYYSKVKGRLTPSSPVYNRLKQLEKTYE